MKIVRNGVEIELTKTELRQAAKEYVYNCDKEENEGLSEDEGLFDWNEESFNEIAEAYRKYLDDTGIDIERLTYFELAYDLYTHEITPIIRRDIA